MKNLISSLTLFFVMTSLAFSQADLNLTQEFLKVSGIAGSLDQIDQMIAGQMEGERIEFDSPEEFEKFSNMMKLSLNSERATFFFTEYIQNNVSDEKLTSLIALYKQPLFKKISELEEKAQDPSSQQDQMEFFTGLQTNPPAKERIEQIVNLNAALKTDEMLVSLMKNMILNMGKGANLFLPEDEKVTLEEIKVEMDAAITPEMMQQINYQLIAMALYTYKDLSAEELNDYISFWQGEDGQFYVELYKNSFDYSFGQMAQTMGESFAELSKE